MAAPLTPPDLVPMPVASREGAVREAMTAAHLDALVVTKPVNARWLTGFTGSNATVVIGGDGLGLITDARYRDQAAQQLAAAGVEATIEITANDVVGAVKHLVGEAARIGFEADQLTWGRHRELAQALVRHDLTPTHGLIEAQRQIKDPGERARLEWAAAIADRSLIEVLDLLDEGPSERRFAAELDHRMRVNGADDTSFETIVAAGINSALPHHRPGDDRLVPGALVVIDFGAQIDGYGSDMTRTLVVGGRPTVEQERLYDAVAQAQAAGVAVVAAGVEARAVDQRCREVLARHDLADAFTHGTGHGLGLEIHEEPILSVRSVGILPAGLIVTVEPGAYLTGFGGVRVEDTVVVTDDGCIPITHCPKGLDPAALIEESRLWPQ